MGKVKGFKEYKRIDEKYIPVRKRLKNYKEFTIAPKESELNLQAARCMDCGVPFCHSGCPLGNLIPDFNDLVYNNNWKEYALGIPSISILTPVKLESQKAPELPENVKKHVQSINISAYKSIINNLQVFLMTTKYVPEINELVWLCGL